MIKRAYAIKIGRKPNVIVNTWDKCKKLVDGFPGAKFKGFTTTLEAEKWLHNQPKTKIKKPKNVFTSSILTAIFVPHRSPNCVKKSPRF